MLTPNQDFLTDIIEKKLEMEWLSHSEAQSDLMRCLNDNCSWDITLWKTQNLGGTDAVCKPISSCSSSQLHGYVMQVTRRWQGSYLLFFGFYFFSQYVFSNNSWVNLRNGQGYYIFGRIIAILPSNVISGNVVEGHNEKKGKKFCWLTIFSTRPFFFFFLIWQNS